MAGGCLYISTGCKSFIDFNGMSICQELSYAERLGNSIYCTIINIFVELFKSFLFANLYQVFLCNTNNLHSSIVSSISL